MAGDAALSPRVVAVVVGMAVVTYVTKAGGLWVLGRVSVSERTRAGLEALPGAVIVAILAPELAAAGPAELAASGVVVLVMWRTERLLPALLGGVGVVLLFRTLG